MNKPFLLATIGCSGFALALSACNAVGGGGKAKISTEDDKTLYAVGLMLGRNLQSFNLTPAELEIVKQGISDQASGKKPVVELETYGPKINALARKRSDARAEQEKKKSKGFIEAASKEPGAELTPSGMVFKSLKPGQGESPKPTDIVKVNYRGTLTDGTEFDSSFKRGQPAEFPLNGVIPCWTEGVGKMKIGEKAKLVCPSNIAYGDMGRPPTIPGGATLVFEVELLEVKQREQPAASMPGAPIQPGKPIQLQLPGGKPVPPPPAKPATPPPPAKH
jgi:FKBP-type peptidyl-prolyl cis-trans isomerase FkpA